MSDISLRTIDLADYETVWTWSLDREFCLANGWTTDLSSDALCDWWRRCVEHPPDNLLRFGIVYRRRMVGYVDLVFMGDGSAELGIAIGESGLWGRGIGSEAIRCTMRCAQSTKGITVFTAETHEANPRAQALLRGTGFRETGRSGQERYRGEWSSLIQYRCAFN